MCSLVAFQWRGDVVLIREGGGRGVTTKNVAVDG